MSTRQAAQWTVTGWGCISKAKAASKRRLAMRSSSVIASGSKSWAAGMACSSQMWSTGSTQAPRWAKRWARVMAGSTHPNTVARFGLVVHP